MTNFEMIDDSAMEQVKGGLSFSIGVDLESGLTIDSDIGSIQVPSPVTLAKNVFKTLGNAVGDLLTAVGNQLTKLGQLFDFS